MTRKTKLAIIIPCYNEEISLPYVLEEIKKINFPDKDVEVIVINDCSTDKTIQVAQAHAITLINLPVNLGIGGAMQTGYMYASKNNFDIAIQLDGDGQHQPDDIIHLINTYHEGETDVIIGSRFLNNEGFQSSILRRIGIKFFYRINYFLTGNRIYDSTSGFRLLNKRAIELAAHNYPDEYPEPESLILFAKKGLRIKEVAVIMRARMGGTSSINSIYYCFKVTLSMIFSYIKSN